MQGGRGDSSGGGAEETTLGIQCWPQRRQIPRRWYCPPNDCGRLRSKRGDGDSNGNGDGEGDGDGNGDGNGDRDGDGDGNDATIL